MLKVTYITAARLLVSIRAYVRDSYLLSVPLPLSYENGKLMVAARSLPDRSLIVFGPSAMSQAWDVYGKVRWTQ